MNKAQVILKKLKILFSNEILYSGKNIVGKEEIA